jgi:isocitrate/isopropylmalate dehydrogenase
MFGSIAGAESLVAALDENYIPRRLMAEAAHGTAPSLAGKDVANPLAMILAGAALLAHGGETMQAAGNAIRKACLDVLHTGIRTADLGGASGTSEFTDAIIARVRQLLSL